MKRCEWANTSELEQSYHDKEWGVAMHEDRRLPDFFIAVFFASVKNQVRCGNQDGPSQGSHFPISGR